MKNRSSFLLVLALAGLGGVFSGCDTMSSRVQERFAVVPPKTQLVDGPEHDVFLATQAVLKRLDFQLSKTAEAQGIVNGFSRIQPGSTLGNARQYSFEIKLSPVGPTQTDVAVLLREQIEGEGLSHATDQAVRDHGLYESFYAMLKEELTTRHIPTPVKPQGKTQ